MVLPKEHWDCKSCGKNTHLDPKDYYMLTFELWDKIGCGDGMLCIGCVEKKLGRKLEARDLLECPLNECLNPYTIEIFKSQ